jgi:hypothetical protein
MQKLLLFFFWLISFAVIGQGFNHVGARSNALAGSSVTIEDVWAYHHNPGALANIKTFSAGVYYDSRFLTKELQTQALAVVVPLKKGVISAGAQFFGYEQYRQSRYGLGYSLQLTERFSAGVQVNAQQLRLANNYGSSFNGTIEAGLMAKISEKWKIGASIMNIGRQRISSLEDRFTSVMRIGAFYQPSKKITVLFEVEKEVIHPIAIKGALEYQIIEPLFVRLGAQSGPTNFAFGFGYKRKGINIDFGTRYHQILGWTPNIGITYQVKQHEAK